MPLPRQNLSLPRQNFNPMTETTYDYCRFCAAFAQIVRTHYVSGSADLVAGAITGVLATLAFADLKCIPW
jgi:hypothetical protein